MAEMAAAGGAVTSVVAEVVAVPAEVAVELYGKVPHTCIRYGMLHLCGSICCHVSGDGIPCGNDLHGIVHCHGHISVRGIQRQMLKRCKVSGWL